MDAYNSLHVEITEKNKKYIYRPSKLNKKENYIMLNNEIKFINKDNNAVIWIDFNNRSVSWSTLTKSTKIIEFVIYHSTSGPPYSLSVPTRLSVGETLRHTDVYNFSLELQSYSL